MWEHPVKLQTLVARFLYEMWGETEEAIRKYSLQINKWKKHDAIFPLCFYIYVFHYWGLTGAVLIIL